MGSPKISFTNSISTWEPGSCSEHILSGQGTSPLDLSQGQVNPSQSAVQKSFLGRFSLPFLLMAATFSGVEIHAASLPMCNVNQLSIKQVAADAGMSQAEIK